jgi:RNA polymerase sigma factor (sigma-70 family)
VSPDKDRYPQQERRFRQLYEEHYRLVQAYAVRRVDALADVADVVAEVFTTAWRRLDDIPPPPADRVWLYGTARRVLADHYRGARRRGRLISRIESSHADPPQAAWLMPDDQLTLAMRQLPEGERETLMLLYWEQLSHVEAAEVLGCSPNAVAIRTHRAKERLREALARPAARAPGSREATAEAIVSLKTLGI